MHRIPPERDIDFASTVIYKAPPEEKRYTAKRQYFSLEERKVSTSEQKKYDKRYYEVGDQFDGSAKSIIAVLMWDKKDWIGQWEAFQIVTAVYQWIQKYEVELWMEIPAKYMNWFATDKANEGDRARNVRDAYEAMQNLTEAYRLREQVNSRVEQFKNQCERAAKAAAEEQEAK
jgi:hypothetical protein